MAWSHGRINIPLIFIKIAAKLGDCLKIGPLNSTAYNMLLQPNIADKKDFIDFTSIIPRNLQQGFATKPLTVQSIWHARLYFCLRTILDNDRNYFKHFCL